MHRKSAAKLHGGEDQRNEDRADIFQNRVQMIEKLLSGNGVGTGNVEKHGFRAVEPSAVVGAEEDDDIYHHEAHHKGNVQKAELYRAEEDQG